MSSLVPTGTGAAPVVIGAPVSRVPDPALTQANGEKAKVFCRYDHEWGHGNRLLELPTRVADDS